MFYITFNFVIRVTDHFFLNIQGISMDGLNEFLDSSTIHGLSHIAKNRRLLRLLWIIVVLAGFTGAGLLIKEALDNWSEAPVSTTTEILPISQVFKSLSFTWTEIILREIEKPLKVRNYFYSIFLPAYFFREMYS